MPQPCQSRSRAGRRRCSRIPFAVSCAKVASSCLHQHRRATAAVSHLHHRSRRGFQCVSFAALARPAGGFLTPNDPPSSAPPSRNSLLRPAALGTDGSLSKARTADASAQGADERARPTSLSPSGAPQAGHCVPTCCHMHVVRKSNLLRTISATKQEKVVLHRIVWCTAALTTSRPARGDVFDFGSARCPLG